ncbi:MAG: thioredoxin [Chitinophagaceae bacterium]|jgi:thioredoxin 1|nr:thioredoxin [Bacteroidota bacterium]
MTFEEIINKDKPVLIDFYADWCGPCKTMAVILKETKQRVGEAATIVKIDVDKNQRIASDYQVSSIPTLILFKNGEVFWRQSGVVPASEIEKMIRKAS